MKTKYILSLTVAAFLCACSSPQYVPQTPNNKAEQPVSLGIDDIDLQNAARELIDSMLASQAFATTGKEKHVLAISRITNDTMQHFDTDILIKKIRVALLNSGRVVVTTAMSAKGAEDEMIYDSRELRGNEEFNQKTIAKKGALISANRSLSGKIIQRNTKIKGTFSDTQRVDYYFQLTVTDLDYGLAVWEDEIRVNKTGSNRSVTW